MKRNCDICKQKDICPTLEACAYDYTYPDGLPIEQPELKSDDL